MMMCSLFKKGNILAFYMYFSNDGLYVRRKAFFENLVSTLFNIMYTRLAAAILSLDAMSQIRCLQTL